MLIILYLMILMEMHFVLFSYNFQFTFYNTVVCGFLATQLY